MKIKPDDHIQQNYIKQAAMLLSKCCNAQTAFHNKKFYCRKCKKQCKIGN